jgi:putative tryptophan/tyrosine transport system substrate-binding protein
MENWAARLTVWSWPIAPVDRRSRNGRNRGRAAVHRRQATDRTRPQADIAISVCYDAVMIHGGMRRREFVTLLGGMAAVWSSYGHAQPAKLPTVGFLGSGAQTTWADWTAAFVQRLHELGWIEGRTVTIEYRWAEGRTERYREIAAEFVRLKVDVIVTAGSAFRDAKQATSTIPIVFAIANDPVGSGMVDSLARPGGNATGVSIQETELAGKRIELLREILPGLRRIAVIANVGYQAAVLEMTEVRDVARKFGLDVRILEIRRAEDILPAFEGLKVKADALYVVLDSLVNANQARIITLALGARLPSIFGTRDYVKAGGLMSYGPNFPDLFRRAAEIVAKTLKGAKPADLPVEQPTEFDLVINLITAKAIGLAIPKAFLLRANEVIE